jgi:hypothetical protein
MSSLASIIFPLGISFWILALIEILGAIAFISFFFKIGITVFEQTIPFPIKFHVEESQKPIKKKEGKFLFTPDHKIYFRSRILFGRTATPFPFKAVGSIDGNLLNIVAKIPIGTTLFFLFWILVWIFAFMKITIRDESMASLLFGILGCGVVWFLFTVSYSIEKRRMETMITELKEMCS